MKINDQIEFETLLEFAIWFKEQSSRKEWETCQVESNWHYGGVSRKLKINFPDNRIIKIKIARWCYEKKELHEAMELFDWSNVKVLET